MTTDGVGVPGTTIMSALPPSATVMSALNSAISASVFFGPTVGGDEPDLGAGQQVQDLVRADGIQGGDAVEQQDFDFHG